MIAEDSDIGEKATPYLIIRWLGAAIKYLINLYKQDQKPILEGKKLKKLITL